MPWGTQTRQLSFIGLSHFDLPFSTIVTPLNSIVVPGIILVEITTVCIYKLPGIRHHCICNYRESVIDVILAKWHHLHNLLTGRNAEQVNDVQWSIEWMLVWVQLSTYLCPRMMQAVGSGSWIRVSLVIILVCLLTQLCLIVIDLRVFKSHNWFSWVHIVYMILPWFQSYFVDHIDRFELLLHKVSPTGKLLTLCQPCYIGGHF